MCCPKTGLLSKRWNLGWNPSPAIPWTIVCWWAKRSLSNCKSAQNWWAGWKMKSAEPSSSVPTPLSKWPWTNTAKKYCPVWWRICSAKVWNQPIWPAFLWWAYRALMSICWCGCCLIPLGLYPIQPFTRLWARWVVQTQLYFQTIRLALVLKIPWNCLLISQIATSLWILWILKPWFLITKEMAKTGWLRWILPWQNGMKKGRVSTDPKVVLCNTAHDGAAEKIQNWFSILRTPKYNPPFSQKTSTPCALWWGWRKRKNWTSIPKVSALVWIPAMASCCKIIACRLLKRWLRRKTITVLRMFCIAIWRNLLWDDSWVSALADLPVTVSSGTRHLPILRVVLSIKINPVLWWPTPLICTV